MKPIRPVLRPVPVVFDLIPQILAGALFAAIVASSSWGQSPQLAKSSPDRQYDIEITRTISNSCEVGELGYTAKNFIVSQGSRTFKARVTEPISRGGHGYWEVPQHLLIVFPAGSVRPNQVELLKVLKKAMSAGWSVKVSRIDGSFTKYETDISAMREELEVPTGTDSDQKTEQAAIDAATDELSWFPGRRALVIQQPQQRSRTLTYWFNNKTKIFSMLYLIDGGCKVGYTGTTFGGRGTPESATFFEKRRLYARGHITK